MESHSEEDDEIEDEEGGMEVRSLPWLAASEKRFLQIKPNCFAHLTATQMQLEDLRVSE